MVTKKQIKDYCKSININDESLIRFIYNNRKRYNFNSYADVRINRICNLTQKVFLDKMLSNIQNNKKEYFYKNSIMEVSNNENIKQRILNKYGYTNELIEYICNLLNEHHNITYKDILLYSSTRFNVDERTVINRISNFKKQVNSPLKPNNFILNLKWNLVRRKSANEH